MLMHIKIKFREKQEPISNVSFPMDLSLVFPSRINTFIWCFIQISQETKLVTKDAGSIPGSRRSPVEGNSSHSRVLAWRIPRTEEPGGLQSMGSHKVGHDLAACTHTCFISFNSASLVCSTGKPHSIPGARWWLGRAILNHKPWWSLVKWRVDAGPQTEGSALSPRYQPFKWMLLEGKHTPKLLKSDSHEGWTR